MLPRQLQSLLAQRAPCMWRNECWVPIAQARRKCEFGLKDVQDAARRWQRFAGLLARLFPELGPTQGIIESPLYAADALQSAVLTTQVPTAGRWFIKGDHTLPVAGSIKARGGIYEVLLHAQTLAQMRGLIGAEDDLRALGSPAARQLFADHEVIVGSTGNLGLSIGIMAAALGFRATVHMSAEAKIWKKRRLRAHRVDVVEHAGDFGAAVAAGRRQAEGNARAYFVDDENSAHLFFGYSVAALRLQEQLQAAGRTVGPRQPLFVYIPCGVGGAPGGITFGLRQLFGDYVHCFLAEPVAAPCMLMRLAQDVDRPINVRELGLDNRTDADGLAVAQASEFAATMLRPLVAGAFTVAEGDFFEDLFELKRSLGLSVEPSATAGMRGPRWVLQSATGHEHLVQHDLLDCLQDATHVIWTTGGAFVPDDEYRSFHERGRELRTQATLGYTRQ